MSESDKVPPLPFRLRPPAPPNLSSVPSLLHPTSDLLTTSLHIHNLHQRLISPTSFNQYTLCPPYPSLSFQAAATTGDSRSQTHLNQLEASHVPHRNTMTDISAPCTPLKVVAGNQWLSHETYTRLNDEVELISRKINEPLLEPCMLIIHSRTSCAKNQSCHPAK